MMIYEPVTSWPIETNSGEGCVVYSINRSGSGITNHKIVIHGENGEKVVLINEAARSLINIIQDLSDYIN